MKGGWGEAWGGGGRGQVCTCLRPRHCWLLRPCLRARPAVPVRGAASSRAKAHQPSLSLSSGGRQAEASLNAQDSFWKTPEPCPGGRPLYESPGTQAVFRGVGGVLTPQDWVPPVQGLGLPQP